MFLTPITTVFGKLAMMCGEHSLPCVCSCVCAHMLGHALLPAFTAMSNPQNQLSLTVFPLIPEDVCAWSPMGVRNGMSRASQGA